MKTHKIIDIHDIKSLKEYFQKNKVLAYGNGSVYNKIKFYLEQYNLHFEDVIYTSNSSILSISGQTYEDSLRDYSIFICSSFYEEIIEFLKSKKIKSITVPTIIIDEKSNKLFHRTLMNKKHKLFINNIKTKNKLKIIFLAINKNVWKLDVLFQNMLYDPYFDPIILVCPDIYNSEDSQILGEMKNTYEYFKSKGYPLISSFDKNKNDWLTLEEIKPDIVFFTNPHNLTKKEYYEDAYMNYLTCYAGYGMHTARYNKGINQYNQIFHNCIWKIFVQNKHMLKKYIKHASINKKNLHLSIDNIVIKLQSKEYNNINVWKNFNTHKKIIWAPHHTIINNSILELGTFIQYSTFMKNLSILTKDIITWSFKPHPLLKFKLYNHPEWGKNKTDEYYHFWESQSNTQYDNSEYINLFKQSDGLIHDSASFLAEYIFTNKPMLYLIKYNTQNYLNKFGKSCLNTAYKASNEQEIISFLYKLLNKIDKKRKSREKFIKKYYADLIKYKDYNSIISIIKNKIKVK